MKGTSRRQECVVKESTIVPLYHLVIFCSFYFFASLFNINLDCALYCVFCAFYIRQHTGKVFGCVNKSNKDLSGSSCWPESPLQPPLLWCIAPNSSSLKAQLSDLSSLPLTNQVLHSIPPRHSVLLTYFPEIYK